MQKQYIFQNTLRNFCLLCLVLVSSCAIPEKWFPHWWWMKKDLKIPNVAWSFYWYFAFVPSPLMWNVCCVWLLEFKTRRGMLFCSRQKIAMRVPMKQHPFSLKLCSWYIGVSSMRLVARLWIGDKCKIKWKQQWNTEKENSGHCKRKSCILCYESIVVASDS